MEHLHWKNNSQDNWRPAARGGIRKLSPFSTTGI